MVVSTPIEALTLLATTPEKASIALVMTSV